MSLKHFQTIKDEVIRSCDRQNKTRQVTKQKTFTSGKGLSGPYGVMVQSILIGSEDFVHVIIRTWLASSFVDNSTGLMWVESFGPSYSHIGWARAYRGHIHILTKVAIICIPARLWSSSPILVIKGAASSASSVFSLWLHAFVLDEMPSEANPSCTFWSDWAKNHFFRHPCTESTNFSLK